MQYRYLGKTGLRSSILSLGSYLSFGHSVDERMALRLMDKAYNSGVNLFDNAEVYALGKSEEIMGSAIRKLKWTRDTYIIMTKVFWGGDKPTQLGLHKKHIFDSCHAALKRFNVEYIDVFLCHRPDINTPLIETISAMHHLIQQGKILYWGTSEWPESLISQAILVAEAHNLTPPCLDQFKYSLMERNRAEKELHYIFENYKLGATTTMPLAGGFLTGKYLTHMPAGSRFAWLKDGDKDLQSEKYLAFRKKIEQLQELALENKMTLAQLSISWCMSNHNISSVIIGASNEEQLGENLNACEHLKTVESLLEIIDSILDNKPSPDHKNFFDYSQIIERV